MILDLRKVWTESKDNALTNTLTGSASVHTPKAFANFSPGLIPWNPRCLGKGISLKEFANILKHLANSFRVQRYPNAALPQGKNPGLEFVNSFGVKRQRLGDFHAPLAAISMPRSFDNYQNILIALLFLRVSVAGFMSLLPQPASLSQQSPQSCASIRHAIESPASSRVVPGRAKCRVCVGEDRRAAIVRT